MQLMPWQQHVTDSGCLQYILKKKKTSYFHSFVSQLSLSEGPYVTTPITTWLRAVSRPPTFKSGFNKHNEPALTYQVMTSWKHVCCSVYRGKNQRSCEALAVNFIGSLSMCDTLVLIPVNIIFVWWKMLKYWCHGSFSSNQMRMKDLISSNSFHFLIFLNSDRKEKNIFGAPKTWIINTINHAHEAISKWIFFADYWIA